MMWAALDPRIAWEGNGTVSNAGVNRTSQLAMHMVVAAEGEPISRFEPSRYAGPWMGCPQREICAACAVTWPARSTA